jgi:hypothetical protein
MRPRAGFAGDLRRLAGRRRDHSGVRRRVRDQFPLLLDTEESGYPASNAYGLSHVPSLFLVDPDGTIGWSLEGFNKKEFLAMAAQAGVNPFHPGENVPEWKAG